MDEKNFSLTAYLSETQSSAPWLRKLFRKPGPRVSISGSDCARGENGKFGVKMDIFDAFELV